GHPPFIANSLVALLLKHRDAAIPALRESRPDVPEELEAIYERMVAKEPDDRFPSMTDVVAALETIPTFETVPDVQLVVHEPSAARNPMSDITVATAPYEDISFALGRTLAEDGAGPSPSAIQRVADLAVLLVEPSRAQASIVQNYLTELGIAQIRTTRT